METSRAWGRFAKWRPWLLPRPPNPMIPTVTAEFALVAATAENGTRAAERINPRLVSDPAFISNFLRPEYSYRPAGNNA